MKKIFSNQPLSKTVLFSRYSFRQFYSNFSLIRKAEKIMFMPKTHYCHYPNRYKKYILLKLIKISSSSGNVSEIPLEEIIGHYWQSNMTAAQELSSLKEYFQNQESVKILEKILGGTHAVNYFQASFTYDIAYKHVFKSVKKDQEEKNSNLIAINDQRYQEGNKNAFKVSSFTLTMKHYLFCCCIPIYFIFRNLINGFTFNPIMMQAKLSMPIISGINKQESGHISAAKGVKFSNDDSFIYGHEFRYGDVIHIFNFWKFSSEIKESFIKNMKESGIKYIDANKLKLDFKIIKNAINISLIFLFSLKRFFKDYNEPYIERMNSFLPKAILHFLQKSLELEYVKPQVELIRNDYNPASILRAIMSKNNNIKTIGIQHTATPYDCPQLCFVNYDRYLLFGNLYKNYFKDFLRDTELVINGKDFLDPVISLKNDKEKQEKTRSDFKRIYGETKKIVMIIMPGNSPMIRVDMRIKMLNAIKKWQINDSEKNREHLVIRFRKKIEIETVKEWGMIYEISKQNKNIIVDFDNFTTQELMNLSDRIIVPHSSYSMTEAMALEKEAFSFDFSGSAFYYFAKYGNGLVLETEEELYQTLSMDNSSFSRNIDYQKLAGDLDAFYDGKNVQRLRNLVLNLSK